MGNIRPIETCFIHPLFLDLCCMKATPPCLNTELDNITSAALLLLPATQRLIVIVESKARTQTLGQNCASIENQTVQQYGGGHNSPPWLELSFTLAWCFLRNSDLGRA